ncbi:MAG TPA: hypothetical protein VHF26_03430 [Trebonia sp.]|nr:hypothetical protein [Trebonia sp.]
MLRVRPVLFAAGTFAIAAGCLACGGSPGGGATSSPSSIAAPPGQNTTMCQPYQTTTIDGGRYTLQDDEWGSSAAECVATSGGTDFTVTRSAIAKPAGGDPGSYPSLYAGCNFGACTKGGLTANPPVLGDLDPGDVTTSLATTDPAGGAYDVSYDIWTNREPTASGAPDGTEVMVWLNRHGGVQPAGSQVASGVSIGGQAYDVWYSPDAGNGPCVTYVMTPARSSVSGLDLTPLFADAAKRGYVQSSWYLIAVEAGFEIWQGGTGLAVKSFSVALSNGA